MIKEKFYTALYPLYSKLINICEDPIEIELIKNSYSTIRAVYMINKNYGQNIVTNDFHKRSRKNEIFKELVEEIAVTAIQGKDKIVLFDCIDKRYDELITKFLPSKFI